MITAEEKAKLEQASRLIWDIASGPSCTLDVGLWELLTSAARDIHDARELGSIPMDHEVPPKRVPISWGMPMSDDAVRNILILFDTDDDHVYNSDRDALQPD